MREESDNQHRSVPPKGRTRPRPHDGGNTEASPRKRPAASKPATPRPSHPGRGGKKRTHRSEAEALRNKQRRAAAAQQKARRLRLVAILGMLVLLVALLAVAGKYVLGRIDDRNSAVAPDPTASYAPVKCTASQVTTALEVKGSTAGQEVTFTVTLTNTSETNPCYLDVGWANMNVTITSGSAYTAATSDCESGSESTILLLDRGMETTRTVSWSGGVGSGCVAPEDNASQPGTYVAEVAFSDSTAPIAQKSFVLN